MLAYAVVVYNWFPIRIAVIVPMTINIIDIFFVNRIKRIDIGKYITLTGLELRCIPLKDSCAESKKIMGIWSVHCQASVCCLWHETNS